MKEKVIVLGKGFLGTRVSEELGYTLVGRDELDPSDFFALRKYLEFEKPGVIVNAIAKTGRPNVDWCESNHGMTIESNVLVPANLSRLSEELGIYFVHLSSGCIYSGDNKGGGFRESDKPNFYGPQFYAITKILAEQILDGRPSLILRPRMPIDANPHPRNLITKLAGYARVIDEQNSMTTVPHMIYALRKLIERRATGVYNFVNPGTISAVEIMQMYKEIVDPSHSFDMMSLNQLDKITKARRSNCYLNTDKLKAEGIILPEIHEAVRHCMISYAKSGV